VTIHADARVYAGTFEPGQVGLQDMAAGRHAWVQVARGRVRANGHDLAEGDGASLSDESALRLEALEAAEVLTFDLA
jgi:redox-sensitive bicupin YhaK (pirin superfamily)